ncbi:recombinase family protein [Streptomyces sp. NPDC059788]|uniref:recombinase family protein n=1 Tax=Streptomyces sp. NPDC059788 TaxID=3346948 RepID=UPI00364A4957
MPTTPPLAFVYDRCATRSHAMLELRLAGCRTYAERQGWDVAGWWVDFGDEALGGERPELRELVGALGRVVMARRAFCLVHHWNRFAHDVEGRLALRRRIARVGGYSATTFGESDEREGDAGEARVPAAQVGRQGPT